MAVKDIKNTLTGKNILVIEDIKINRDISRMMLEETGAGLFFAENGKIALDMFMENPNKFDLILTDISMPEMDGHQMARRIRGLKGKGKMIPIIAMTANMQQSDINKSYEAGMNDHIGKPANQIELIKKIIGFINPVS